MIVTTVQTISETDEMYWQRTNQPLPPGEYVALEVHDNGMGMDEATLGRIFDPFFTTKFTGRGLGLAATLGIVRGHRGGLRVSSRPGTGTIFELLFPVCRETAVVQPPPPNTAPLTAGRCILVIDDEEPVREAIRDILENEETTVLLASNGARGIELYREKWPQINLVLLDLSMPQMNGSETYHHLREINPQVPVLLCSGYSEEEARQRFKNTTHAVSFLQKPFNMDQLLQTIDNCLK